jgi:uncharacterized phage protein gp47/JayE
MSKSITQIRDEIANFYLAVQDEITDVSTGSVAGGLIYAISAALKDLYDDLDQLERQAYIATATGQYLDLLIEGGFFLARPGSSRSVGYVVIYSDEPITNPEFVGNNLICAEYNYETNEFVSNLSAATKFTATNQFGSSSVSYALIQPKNSSFYRRDETNRFIINLKGKNAQYLILPVASVLKGAQVNVEEGALNTFPNPPGELRYVSNVSNPGEIIFASGGLSSAPLFSRITSSNSFNSSNNNFSVINAVNFSARGFLEVSYKSISPTELISGVYANAFGDEISAGLVFEYGSKTQTSISLKSADSYIKIYENNELTEYTLLNFTYQGVTYSVDSSDVWSASQNVTLSPGLPGEQIVGPAAFVSGSSVFFSKFFAEDPWVLRERRVQVSEDIIFDPDSALSSETYVIKESFRLSTAQDALDDNQYRALFKNYINSLPRATSNSLEFAAKQVPGISFSKTLPSESSPPGTAVLLAAADNGILSLSQKQAVINFLKDDWVAAGINLIVRSPDLINFSMAVNVALTTPELESFVRRSIREEIENYLSSKEPGDEIKYGEIYAIISSINGVKNVSKLIVGKNEPTHYLNYRDNYALVAAQRLVDHSQGIYEFYDTPVFKEDGNDITISSDINGIEVSPIQFSQYENFITSENIFSEFNQNVYGAVFGIFASDGGDSINVSDYTVTIYPEIFISEEATLGLRFTVDATDASVSLTVNGQSIISTDVSSERVLFIPISSSSSDVTLIFEQEAGVEISEIQAFLHTESIDTCLVAEINSLFSLSFIDSERVEIVYGLERKSNRIKIIKTISINQPDGGQLLDLSTALVRSDSLSVFQSLLRDYQYGTNSSGRNPGFFKNMFSDTSIDDEAFRHFFVYAITAPLSTSFDEYYPLTPKTASNDLISDYALSNTEISRFKQISIRVPSRPLPAIGILVE